MIRKRRGKERDGGDCDRRGRVCLMRRYGNSDMGSQPFSDTPQAYQLHTATSLYFHCNSFLPLYIG